MRTVRCKCAWSRVNAASSGRYQCRYVSLFNVTERTPRSTPCTTPHHPQLSLPLCPFAPLPRCPIGIYQLDPMLNGAWPPTYRRPCNMPIHTFPSRCFCVVRLFVSSLQMFMREHDKLRRMHQEHTRPAGGAGGDTAENADNSTSHTHHTSARVHTAAPLMPSRSYVQVRKEDQ